MDENLVAMRTFGSLIAVGFVLVGWFIRSRLAPSLRGAWAWVQAGSYLACAGFVAAVFLSSVKVGSALLVLAAVLVLVGFGGLFSRKQ